VNERSYLQFKITLNSLLLVVVASVVLQNYAIRYTFLWIWSFLNQQHTIQLLYFFEDILGEERSHERLRSIILFRRLIILFINKLVEVLNCNTRRGTYTRLDLSVPIVEPASDPIGLAVLSAEADHVYSIYFIIYRRMYSTYLI
jgi:hypothetical protein